MIVVFGAEICESVNRECRSETRSIVHKDEQYGTLPIFLYLHPLPPRRSRCSPGINLYFCELKEANSLPTICRTEQAQVLCLVIFTQRYRLNPLRPAQ